MDTDQNTGDIGGYGFGGRNPGRIDVQEELTNLEKFVNTCVALRKVRSLLIEQPSGVASFRPQSHLMVVAPFGTFKSTLIRELRKHNPKEFMIVTDFTRAGLTGTINKDGTYVPTMLSNYAGKTVAIDEWNNIDEYGQQALLSLLENQELTRYLGFKVKKDWNSRSTYSEFKVKENMISAKIYFSCIACAMTYPIPVGHVQVQKSKAVLSRYMPVFIEGDEKEIFKTISGHKKWNLRLKDSAVDEIRITKSAYQDYIAAYEDYMNKYNLIPNNPDDKGFISRVNLDVVRIALAENIPEDGKMYLVEDSKILRDALKYSGVIMRGYLHPFTQGKFNEFKRLYEQFSDKPIDWFAEQLNVTENAIKMYSERINIDVGSEREKRFMEIKKEVIEELARYKGEISVAVLARNYGVSWTFINSICKDWKKENSEYIQVELD